MTVQKSTRPNLVFILTDDQRYDTISALGNRHIHTPNLDLLAARGTACTHAHIPGGTSGAVCMPSRAMLHTGRTLFHLTDAGETIDPDHALLGETLRTAGYRTFGTGKWHNGRSAFHRSFSDGSEIFFGGMADHWNVPAYTFDPSGAYDAVRPFVADPFMSNKTGLRTCDHIHAGCHSTDLIAAAACQFIDTPSAATSFFAYVSFLAPHDPRTMPQEYRDLYDAASLPLPAAFLGGHPFDNGELHIRDERLAGFPRTPDDIRRHLAEYYAMISHLDDRIGDIVAAVRRQGVLDQTIFVLAGDNGLALGGHGLMGKQSLYDHSTRVPLLFAGPRIPAGERRDALVYLLDLFPTLCELANVPQPATVEGESLLPVICQDAPGREALYLAYTDKHRGVRTATHKLIEYVVGGRHVMTQLFDLVNDPAETRNLADDPAQATRLVDLRRRLVDLRDAWDDRETPWGKTFWQNMPF